MTKEQIILNDTKDKVAKKWGLPSFEELFEQGRPTGNMVDFMDEVALLLLSEKEPLKKLMSKEEKYLRKIKELCKADDNIMQMPAALKAIEALVNECLKK